MDWKDYAALYGAGLSSILAWRSFASARPRLSIWPGQYGRGGMQSFHVRIHNDGDDAVQLTPWFIFRKAEDKAKVFREGTILETMDDVRKWSTGETQHLLVPPKEHLDCMVETSTEAPRLFVLFAWERASWMLPLRLPLVLHIPKRRMFDMHKSQVD